MAKKTVMSSLFAAGMLLALSGQAPAVSLSSLTAGSSITVGDVVFDSFAYEDVGGPFGDVAVSAADIDVTGSSTATTVSLLFSFDPIALGEEEVFEISGRFSTSVSGSSRELTGVEITLQGSVGGAAFDFIEAGSNTLGDSATIDPGTAGPVSIDAVLTNLTTYDLLWDLQGETDVGSSATVNSLLVTFSLRDPNPPQPQPAPVPAALPLLLAGLIGMHFIRRRRNTA
jgi:hypothetical protein